MAKLTDVRVLPAEETIRLERLKVAVQERIGPQVARDAEWQSLMDRVTGDMIVRLGSYVLADKLSTQPERVTFQFPSSPWQHFKREYAKRAVGLDKIVMRWLVQRRPVRTSREVVTVTVSNFATFPENQTVYPKDLGRVVLYQQVERNRYGDISF